MARKEPIVKEIKRPEIITLRCCSECNGRQTWSVHGFAYPAGDDSKWKCYECGYEGRPGYHKYKIIRFRSMEHY